MASLITSISKKIGFREDQRLEGEEASPRRKRALAVSKLGRKIHAWVSPNRRSDAASDSAKITFAIRVFGSMPPALQNIVFDYLNASGTETGEMEASYKGLVFHMDPCQRMSNKMRYDFLDQVLTKSNPNRKLTYPEAQMLLALADDGFDPAEVKALGNRVRGLDLSGSEIRDRELRRLLKLCSKLDGVHVFDCPFLTKKGAPPALCSPLKVFGLLNLTR